MKNKYYTPEIEEFHVGFEYEYDSMSECGSSTKYVKDIFKVTDNVNRLFKDLPNDWYDLPRVKYLDKEDIESLGFKQCSTDVNWYDYKEGRYWLYKEGEEDWRWIISDEQSEISFAGEIKNKSELKRLLKQLRIQ